MCSRHGTVPWRVRNAGWEVWHFHTSVRAVFEMERSGQAGTERNEALASGWQRRRSRRFGVRLRRHRLRGGHGVERHGLDQDGRRDAGLRNRAARSLPGRGRARTRAAGHRVAARWTVAGASTASGRRGAHDALGSLRSTDLPVRHQGRPHDEHHRDADASARRHDATHPGNEPAQWDGPPRSKLRPRYRMRQASRRGKASHSAALPGRSTRPAPPRVGASRGTVRGTAQRPSGGAWSRHVACDPRGWASARTRRTVGVPCGTERRPRT